MLRLAVVLGLSAAGVACYVPPSAGWHGMGVAKLRGGGGAEGATRVNMVATPKLTYFDARGVVEPTRLLLAAAGVEFEDKRYAVDMTTKPPSAPEFNADKESGALNVNMARAPILDIDGAQIGQSHAIARFLARKYGMMGGDEIESAQIDTVYEHVRDIKDAWVKVRINAALDEQEKKSAVEKYLTSDLPEWCAKLEACMKLFKAADDCAVGDKMSLADISIYAWLSCYYPAENKDQVAKAYSSCPKLSAVMKAVGSSAGIRAWEAARPVTFM